MRDEVQRCHVELATRLRGRMMEWEQIAMIVAASSDAIISCDPAGRIVSWNHAAERMFGYLARHMIGRTAEDITPTDRWEEAVAIWQRVSQGERVDHFETVRVAGSGELIEVEMSIFPLEDADGIVTGNMRCPARRAGTEGSGAPVAPGFRGDCSACRIRNAAGSRATCMTPRRNRWPPSPSISRS